MPVYRKKPVTVEARRWSGRFDSEAAALARWCGGKLDTVTAGGPDDAVPDLAIATLEGTMHASPGDWIIRGVQGEFYPCKPAIFDATYEAPDSSQSYDADQWARYERAKARYFTASEHPSVVALRDQIVGLAVLIDEHVPPGRNQALALTHLEDLQMRANRGIFAPEGLQ